MSGGPPDAAPFPVGLGDRVLRPEEGHHHHEATVEADRLHRMGAAAGGLADDGGPLQVLEVVGELLGSREGLRAGQDVDRQVLREALAGDGGRGGGLPDHLAVAIHHAIEERRLVKQVAGEVGDHLWRAATIVPQVEDQGVAAAEEGVRAVGDPHGLLLGDEAVEAKDPDVAVGHLGRAEEPVVPLGLGHHPGHGRIAGRAACVGHDPHPEVLVVTDRAKVVGEASGEGRFVGDRVVVAGRRRCQDALGHGSSLVREDVLLGHGLADRGDDRRPGRAVDRLAVAGAVRFRRDPDRLELARGVELEVELDGALPHARASATRCRGFSSRAERASMAPNSATSERARATRSSTGVSARRAGARWASSKARTASSRRAAGVLRAESQARAQVPAGVSGKATGAVARRAAGAGVEGKKALGTA